MKPSKIAEEAIDMFLEYRDQHGQPENMARLSAINEIEEGSQVKICWFCGGPDADTKDGIYHKPIHRACIERLCDGDS